MFDCQIDSQKFSIEGTIFLLSCRHLLREKGKRRETVDALSEDRADRHSRSISGKGEWLRGVGVVQLNGGDEGNLGSGESINLSRGPHQQRLLSEDGRRQGMKRRQNLRQRRDESMVEV